MNKRINFVLFIILLLLLMKLSLFSQSEIDSIQANESPFQERNEVFEPINKIEKSSSLEFNGDVTLAITNPEYCVTPGDKYLLRFFTSAGEIMETLQVSAEYVIDIPNFGCINCIDKKFLELKDELKSKINASYPYSSPQLEIIDIGYFQIKVIGEVLENRFIKAWGLTRLSDIIDSERTEYSSYRNIEIIDHDGLKRTFDLYKAKRFGDFSQDPTLRPGDQVCVFKSRKNISINGSVYRPGHYQVLEGECLADLINNYADGFKDNADRQQIVLRRINCTDTNTVGESFIVKWENASNVSLKNMDQIEIPSLQEKLPIVYLEGAIDPNANEADKDLKEISVSQKITDTFYPGETLGEFVRRHKPNLLQVSDLGNAYLLREGKHIPVDISKYLYRTGSPEEIVLAEQDKIIIPFFQYYVTVSGAVSSPGRFPYIPDRTWRYYVNLAGGIDSLRNKNENIIVYSNNDEKQDPSQYINPESKIEVPSNSTLYHFNQYSPVILTTLSIISTSISLYYLAN